MKIHLLFFAIFSLAILVISCSMLEEDLTIDQVEQNPPQSLSVAQLKLQSDRLHIAAQDPHSPSIISVESRSFLNMDEFIRFAEKALGAKRIISPEGKTIGLTGDYTQTGDILFQDANGKVFEENDFIAAYLGGESGKFGIAGKIYDLQKPSDKPSQKSFSTIDENCNGNDCIVGESWVKHGWFYHSVGSKTRQTSGGKGPLNYECCPGGGEKQYVDGRKKCRYRKPGAWRFDPSLKAWIPVTLDPYIYTDIKICQKEILRNELRVISRFLVANNTELTFDKTESNALEVSVERWLLDFRVVDFGDQIIKEIHGVCGFHSSSMVGNVRTSAGWTGDNNILCN